MYVPIYVCYYVQVYTHNTAHGYHHYFFLIRYYASKAVRFSLFEKI